MASGGQLHYDALVLCLGALARTRYEHVITIEGRHGDELRDLVDRIEGGHVSRLAFVVPERLAWPLPLYEVALMSAARTAAKGLELEITFLTSERAPLEIFGESASSGVSKLLGERGIELITSVRCEVPSAGQILISLDRRVGGPRRTSVDPVPRRLSADQVVSLPELYGPHVRGLPGSVNGFIPVDLHCRCVASSGSTPPATRPISRSSTAGSRRSRPTPPPSRSPRLPVRQSSQGRFTRRFRGCC